MEVLTEWKHTMHFFCLIGFLRSQGKLAVLRVNETLLCDCLLVIRCKLVSSNQSVPFNENLGEILRKLLCCTDVAIYRGCYHNKHIDDIYEPE